MTTRRDLYRVVIVTKKPIIRFCKKKNMVHIGIVCVTQQEFIYLFYLVDESYKPYFQFNLLFSDN
jgi:hypothetical protein